ncbi:hypothetical protein D9M71_480030 [compost metagenome]
MQVGGFFAVGDVQVAATFTITFIALLLALMLLQGHQLGLPGGGRKQAEVGLGTVPVGRIAITEGLVEAVDTIDPALQGGAQEFQARIVDDQALHAALPYSCD